MKKIKKILANKYITLGFAGLWIGFGIIYLITKKSDNYLSAAFMRFLLAAFIIMIFLYQSLLDNMFALTDDMLHFIHQILEEKEEFIHKLHHMFDEEVTPKKKKKVRN